MFVSLCRFCNLYIIILYRNISLSAANKNSETRKLTLCRVIRTRLQPVWSSLKQENFENEEIFINIPAIIDFKRRNNQFLIEMPFNRILEKLNWTFIHNYFCRYSFVALIFFVIFTLYCFLLRIVLIFKTEKNTYHNIWWLHILILSHILIFIAI